MASPTPIRQPRRRSFMDVGGANSLSNFAHSFQRAQLYMGLALFEADQISPCTLPPDCEHPAAPREAPRYGSVDACSARSVVGQKGSTRPQTVFNSINTLVGIAMLALPYGLRLSGWVCGAALLALCAVVTSCTAKLLGRALERHPRLHSYSDIARECGGARAQLVATALLSVDLVGALLLLVLLFGDSFAVLVPVDARLLKLGVVCATLALSFAPLSLLSAVSLAGVVCTGALLAVTLVCGLSTHAAGLLWHAAPLRMWPRRASDVLLSIGIFMAPWGGHPVFPELYRDMRHPRKYAGCCNTAFGAAWAVDAALAAMGYLMYGAACRDSLTKNLMANPAYPPWTRPVFCVLLGLLPLLKLPLIVRPIIGVYEAHFDLHRAQRARVGLRVLFMALLLAVSLVLTSFGKVIAFLGSAICFTICVTLPLLFHLRLFGPELSTAARLLCWAGVATGVLGAVLGTYAAIAYDI